MLLLTKNIEDERFEKITSLSGEYRKDRRKKKISPKNRYQAEQEEMRTVGT